jgi:hypothetical protein
MRLRATESPNTAPTLKQLSLWSDRQPTSDMTHDSPELLQCTPTVANDEAADSRYWTTYDHYMIEREARALRREYVYGMLANGWRRLRQWLTASSPVRAGSGRR